MKKGILSILGATVVAATMFAPSAEAQATRTWVSGVGDDVNPCSRTAPCKTYAGAISKTAAGGEISTLDPGGYGAVTITKSISITGDGTYGSILAPLTNGITVNAASTDKVHLRNIAINGAGQGLSGIRFLSGAQLVVENVTIHGFNTRGIDVSMVDAAGLNLRNISLRNVHISNGGGGIRLANSSVDDFIRVTLENWAIGSTPRPGQ